MYAKLIMSKGQGDTIMKTSQEIILKIKAQKELYIHEVEMARKRLKRHEDELTAQQISQEIIFIQDMESRAYAMTLLLEEIEED